MRGMDLSAFRHTDSTTISAPPEAVWAVISDPSRMGELSPVCTGGEWDEGASAAPGAWFTGHNAIGEYTWSTRCEVEAAEPGRSFRFVNHGPDGARRLVRWGYELEPEGDGTKVTETWEVLPEYEDFVLEGDPSADVGQRLEGMAVMARDGMTATLAKLKEAVEG